MPRLHFTPGKDPVPILQEAGWAPGPVWTGGKSRPHRDLIPDHPACSQLLYRLSYPAHTLCSTKKQSDELSNTSSKSNSSSSSSSSSSSGSSRAVVVVVVVVAAAAVMFMFFLQEVFWGIQRVILVEFMFKEQAWSYVPALRTWDCLYSSQFHQKR